MNLAKLKAYAPIARQEFIQAVTDRAGFHGITQGGDTVVVLPISERGDSVVIDGKVFPRKVAAQRKALEDRVRQHGFAQTMEALAYTWFNRLVAIRYMEVHGYLDHGYRVLSPSPHRGEGQGEGLPEILEHAEHIALPGLSQQTVIDLKIDGTKDAELYRRLLMAQCAALHSTMPFIFPLVDDETELLLPDNLLHSDSLIRKLVREVADEDCASVEILGWLYQFYIAEKKKVVMDRKSAVPTEDIPAVTQLFTPHWIVRYLVENSLGRLWLLNRPASKLREQMPYYIEGEAEVDFIKITKPEDIRLLDPAVGSGHMLTYAFDLLYAIYVEEGYAPSEIPALILSHNLHGMDICPRAAQLSALALVLKGRERSSRFFRTDQLVQPHILALEDVRFAEGELSEYLQALNLGGLLDNPMLELLHQFEEATTFGSLIRPCLDGAAIAYAHSAIEAKDLGGQLLLRLTHRKVLRVLDYAEALTQRYHVVVANPPYMGTKFFNNTLKAFIVDTLEAGKADTYGAFMVRNLGFVHNLGFIGMISIPNWMFLSSFVKLRSLLLRDAGISSLVHNGRGVWGSDFGSCSFVMRKGMQDREAGIYKRLFTRQGDVASNDELVERFFSPDFPTYKAVSFDFRRIPGSPIAYWLKPSSFEAFEKFSSVGSVAKPRQGMSTNDNARFLRRWFEVPFPKIGFGCQSLEDTVTSQRRWFPYNKGGEFRKWFGNAELVVNWEDDGKEIKHWLLNNPKDPETTHWSRRIINTEFYCKPGLTWTFISSSAFGVRYTDAGFLFDVGGSSLFPGTRAYAVLSLLCSAVTWHFLKALNPTLNFQAGNIADVPWNSDLPLESEREATLTAECAISLARADWDNFETSWDFRNHPLVRPGLKGSTLEASWRNWEVQSTDAVARMQRLEEENNRLFIAAYGLEGELQPEVPEAQITLFCNPANRYKKKPKKRVATVESSNETSADAETADDEPACAPEEVSRLFRADTIKECLSYAVGCMMGRYSLDHPGLILANAGATLRDFQTKVGRSQEQLTFTPDEDGIIPVLDTERFEDDLVARTREFMRVAFGDVTLEENLRFVEECLAKDLRKYFLTDFFKYHRKTYKNRPIYWMFSSGRQRAFQCLVYLHRYNEGTLSRMRTEYVIPLQGQISSRIDQLESEKAKATSTSHRKKLQKEQDVLRTQQTELRTFDEKLKHAADQKIKLDLDDGVKVNYGKFGDLLADVESVTGGDDE